VWLLLLLLASHCRVWVGAASAAAIPALANLAARHYIVLVGIPLVENVLPLRALARELAARGHR
jgi:hypothetical protein